MLRELSPDIKNSAAIGATLFLMITFATVLYRASYKAERAEVGQDNRELVLAYDACKRACYFLQGASKLLRELDEKINKKEKITVIVEGSSVVGPISTFKRKSQKEEVKDLITFDDENKLKV